MSEQESTRPSLKGIESTRSQITSKFKLGVEEEENMIKAEKADTIDAFLSRIGNDASTTEVVEPEEEMEKEEVVDEGRKIRDIFADLTAGIEEDEAEDEVLKPEISYQDIEPEKEEEPPINIYASDSVSKEVEDDPFLGKFSDISAKDTPYEQPMPYKDKPVSYEEKIPYVSKKTAPVIHSVQGNNFLIVQETNGNIAISFEVNGKSIVSLKMPLASIPNGYPVSASLAPDIGLVLTYTSGRKSVLSVVLEHGDENVKTEIIGGIPSVRKISFGGMEFEVFAGAEVVAGMFSVIVEEDRLVYKY